MIKFLIQWIQAYVTDQQSYQTSIERLEHWKYNPTVIYHELRHYVFNFNLLLAIKVTFENYIMFFVALIEDLIYLYLALCVILKNHFISYAWPWKKKGEVNKNNTGHWFEGKYDLRKI